MRKIQAEELVKIFESKGFHYTKDLLFNYYISMITKPFVILTGISGSGKSKIAEVFAEIIGDGSVKNYELIPVKPNWRDNKGLFGYHNLIDNSYNITPMISLFIRALKNPDMPFFLILDEMNIAKTEHYFADYLSLIESRRIEKRVDLISPSDSDVKSLENIFQYDDKTSLSEAIILSAIDIGKFDSKLKIEEYRGNRFSELWKTTIGTGNNWTAQYRSELNQKDKSGNPSRLAGRVFEGGNGEYRLKKKADMAKDDRALVEKLESAYADRIKIEKQVIVQNNIILHNGNICLGTDGTVCDCQNCTYKNDKKYLCEKIWNANTNEYLIPPEMPIPENLFTIGTVNVDETTYMFSPKVLDRSNVIEFNEVDFAGIYNLSKENEEIVNAASKTVVDEKFYFDKGMELGEMKISISTKDDVDKFIKVAPDEFDDIIKIFAVLKKSNLHFGYRVMNEISLYVVNVDKYCSYEDRFRRAVDNQILQKILPKLYGSYDVIWNPLVEILGLLLVNQEELKVENADSLIEKLKQITNGEINELALDGTNADRIFKYPKSAIKIIEMLNDLESSGFASFIK